MSEKLTYALYEFFEEDDIALYYLGDFSDKSLLALTDIIHNSDEKSGNFGSLKSKTIYLIIEAFQNIIRYSLNTSVNNFFMLRKIEHNIFISTANIISDERVIYLKDRIDDLNKMDSNALKNKYKEILVNKKFSEAGGAGLGLVEISRKTKQKIDYYFEKYHNEDDIFYILLKYIKNHDVKQTNVFDVKDFYNFFLANQVIVFFKHEFGEAINEAVIRVCEINYTTSSLRQKKLVYHLSVEILQNLSLHALEIDGKKEGVFYVTKVNGEFNINVGNYINNFDINDFNKFLKILKQSSKTDLDIMYRKQLVAEEFNGNGGLGFIDIAREATEFNYKFFEINDNYSFFTFSFKI
ncbi:MAG: SiaB family protein kinase [Bacteroidales bacterium]|nr:SiaB family protein kinase [Bacteroidales bacterium]